MNKNELKRIYRFIHATDDEMMAIIEDVENVTDVLAGYCV